MAFTIIPPIQSRLGAEHANKIIMGSSQYPQSSSESRGEVDDLISEMKEISASSAPRRSNKRFTSIDFMLNGNISVASADFTLPSSFSVDLSTEENYSADDMEFYGDYECVRRTLDYSYHGTLSDSGSRIFTCDNRRV